MGGIEPIESTNKGIKELAQRGIMPIISHYRAPSSSVHSYINSPEDMYYLWQSAVEIASQFGMVIGPTCIPCQNNVIALPYSDVFHYY